MTRIDFKGSTYFIAERHLESLGMTLMQHATVVLDQNGHIQKDRTGAVRDHMTAYILSQLEEQP